jgi:hypothetical protein
MPALVRKPGSSTLTLVTTMPLPEGPISAMMLGTSCSPKRLRLQRFVASLSPSSRLLD